MKFEQINRRFTEKVAELLSHGYIMNAATMGGSQGEIAKVDLTDGNKIVRVMLSTERGIEHIGDRFYDFSKIVLTIGTSTDNVKIHSSDYFCSTIWNNHLVDIITEEFYQIGRGEWYGTKEESMAQQDKRTTRLQGRHVDNRYQLSDDAKAIVLSFMKRQPKCKSIKLSEIQAVIHHHVTTRSHGLFGKYTVSARGYSFDLK